MRPIYINLFLFIFCNNIYGQDINFSQFYEMPILRNPALAGVFNGDIRCIGAFRNQWQAVPVNYRTVAGSFEIRRPARNGNFLTFGVQFTNDAAGDSKLGKTQVLPVLSFHKLINPDYNLYITAAFGGGYVSQRFDPTNLRFGDQFVNGAYSATNPTSATFSNTSTNYFDLSSGVSVSGEAGNYKYYLGGAYFHFNDPKVAFSALNDVRLNRKIVFNGGISFRTSDNGDRFVLYSDYFTQGGNSQFQGGALFKKMIYEEDGDENQAIAFGCFYRWNDALVPVVKYQYEKWTIGVTYDVNVSKLRTASQFRGGFEITLTYRDFLNMFSSERYGFGCYPIDPDSGVRYGRKFKY